MVTYDKDLVVIGGRDHEATTSSDIYILKCSDGKLQWHEMSMKLNTARAQFVATIIPTSSLSNV